jgi:erythromycin esterase
VNAQSLPNQVDQSVVDEEVTEWIRQRGFPLSTTDPRKPLWDLDSLRGLVGDDTVVVGIGPSTYGGHEQFTVTHRIIRFLVEELGFRTVATEEDWDVALDLDRYVQTGEGDLDALMKRTGVPWRVREVQDTIEWIKDYNAANDEKVRFVGVGVIDTRVPVYEEVSGYVKRVAPDKLAALREHFDVIQPASDEHVRWFITQVADKGSFVEHARAALKLVESLPHQDGDREHEWIAQQTRQIVSFYEHYAYHLVDDGYRDEKMAENLNWWYEFTGHKIAYWSTNAHSARSGELTINVPPRGTLKFKPTGGHLRELFGDKYFSIGLTFAHGTVNSGWGLPPFTSRPIPAPVQSAEFVEGRFVNYGSPRYLLSLHNGVPLIVREWLREPVKARVIGSICDAAQPADEYYMTGGSLAEWYDVIIHQQELSPTEVL